MVGIARKEVAVVGDVYRPICNIQGCSDGKKNSLWLYKLVGVLRSKGGKGFLGRSADAEICG